MTIPDNPKPHIVTQTSQILTPTLEAETKLPIRKGEWQRLHDRIERLHDPMPNLKAWGQTSLGFAVAAGLTLIPWVPAYHVLPDQQQLAYAWVTPTLVCASAACVIIAIVCFVVSRKVTEVQADSAKQICDDMKQIEKDFDSPRTSTSGP